MRRRSKITDSEKREREDERLVRKSPKKKPPRKDRKRTRVRDEDTHEKDPDKEQDKKDTSKNYKDAAERVVLRYMISKDKLKPYRRKEDGRIVRINEQTFKDNSGVYEEIEGDDEDTEDEEGSGGIVHDWADDDFVIEVIDEMDSDHIVEESDLENGQDFFLDELEENFDVDDEDPTFTVESEDPQQEASDKMYKRVQGLPQSVRDRLQSVIDGLSVDFSAGEELSPLDELTLNVELTTIEREQKETASKVEKMTDGIPPYILKEVLEEYEDLDKEDYGSWDKEKLDNFLEDLENLKRDFDKGKTEMPSAIKTEVDDIKDDYSESLSGEQIQKVIDENLSKGTTEEFRKIKKELRKLEKEEAKKRKEEKPERREKVRKMTPEKRKERKEKLESKKDKKKLTPEEQRELLSISEFEDLLDDPIERADDLPEEGVSVLDVATYEKEMRERAGKTFKNYQNAELDNITSNIRKITKALEDMDPSDTRTLEVRAMLEGLKLAEVYAKAQEKDDDGRSSAPSTTRLLLWAINENPEAIGDLAMTEIVGRDHPLGAKGQQLVQSQLSKVTSEEWLEMIPEDHPAYHLVELLNDETKGRFLTDSDRDWIKEYIQDIMLGDVAYGDPADNAEGDGEGGNRTERSDGRGSTNAPNVDDYDNAQDYEQAVREWRDNRIQEQTSNFETDQIQDDSLLSFEEAQRKQQQRLEEMKREQEQAQKEREAEREQRLRESSLKPRTPSFHRKRGFGTKLFSINTLYNNIIGNRTFKGDMHMRKISKKQASDLTRAMDELADTIQKNARQLGIPEKVAMDYAMRTDMLSDAIERTAEFDASTIGEETDGPLEMIDSHEPWMNDEFTGEEFDGLRTHQEDGMFSNAKAASRKRTRRASRRTRR